HPPTRFIQGNPAKRRLRGGGRIMASFGKLTDYFNRRKSREELRVGRSSRRSGSYCCTVAEAR
ncbi:hypothetical protein CHARACLAT_021908, partial [Characodon lateralis]|nr:hypothetical protein [Characodon lateralis]